MRSSNKCASSTDHIVSLAYIKATEFEQEKIAKVEEMKIDQAEEQELEQAIALMIYYQAHIDANAVSAAIMTNKVVILQRQIRCFQARVVVRSSHARKCDSAITTLQRVVRGYLAKNIHKSTISAVINLQCHVRCFQARLCLYRRKLISSQVTSTRLCKDFEKVEKVGEGNYGVVYVVKQRSTSKCINSY